MVLCDDTEVAAQDAKAAALGPRHQVNMLAEVLAEPMLSTVQRQADTAAANGWFWTYQLEGVKVRCGIDGVLTPGSAADQAYQLCCVRRRSRKKRATKLPETPSSE